MSEYSRRIIALNIRCISLGFIAIEEPRELLDWGVRRFSSRRAGTKVPLQRKIEQMLDNYDPQIVVVNIPLVQPQALAVSVVKEISRRRSVAFKMLSPSDISAAFGNRHQNKFELAAALAGQITELRPYLPSKRKPWESEPYQMRIFDAAALALAYLHSELPSQPGEFCRRPLISE